MMADFNDIIDASVNHMLRTEQSHMCEVNNRITHAILGIADEAGELVGALKKMVYYNMPLDVVNMEEELGDLWWYFRLFMYELANLNKTTTAEEFDKILEMNRVKLEKRYPDKYTDDLALNRNVEAERKAMENVNDGKEEEKKQTS